MSAANLKAIVADCVPRAAMCQSSRTFTKPDAAMTARWVEKVASILALRRLEEIPSEYSDERTAG